VQASEKQENYGQLISTGIKVFKILNIYTYLSKYINIMCELGLRL